MIAVRVWLIRKLGMTECGAYGGIWVDAVNERHRRWCRKSFGHSDSCAFDLLDDSLASQPGHDLRQRAKGWGRP